MKAIKTLSDIVGNEQTIEMLRESIKSAQHRNTCIDHIFISGFSGGGKSSLATAIAGEMKVSIEKLMCNSIANNPQILNTKMLKLPNKSILFLDELHSLKIESSESLYSYLESGQVEIRYPDKVIQMPGNHITIIGATTNVEKIPVPLMNRFPIHIRLNPYTEEELKSIILANAIDEKLDLDSSALQILSTASRGVPRNAIQFLRRVRDHVISNSISTIDENIVITALNLMGIDKFGLNVTDRAIIKCLYETFNLSPTGLSSIANAINENEEVIQTQHEPHLMKSGILIRTSKGRALSEIGVKLAMQICQ